MENMILVLLFLLAVAIIVHRAAKLFTSDCGECGGECSCCQSSMPRSRAIKLDNSVEE